LKTSLKQFGIRGQFERITKEEGEKPPSPIKGQFDPVF